MGPPCFMAPQQLFPSGGLLHLLCLALRACLVWRKGERKAVKRKISGRTLQMHYSACTSEQPTCKRLHSPNIRGTQDTLTTHYDAGRELTVGNTSQDQLGQGNGVHHEGKASA